jgi:T-complex protein 1 subunit alpha
MTHLPAHPLQPVTQPNPFAERIQKILATGANVILTTQGIDDLCLKYFVEAGAMAVRRVAKEDMKRIARATGATMVLSLSNMEGEEAFETGSLGFAESVAQERVSDDEFIIISKPKAKTAASILLRGANDFMLDEIQRSVHDALCVVKRVLESKKVVPGGGAVEAALSVYLETFARQLASREQLAIAAFAQALLVIPKTLAVNAAQDAVDLTTKLCALHHAAQSVPDKAAYKYIGLDLVNGVVRDSVKAGVLEPAMSKIKSLKFATEAAITILRIDDMIKMDQEQKQEGSAYANAMARGELDDGCGH